MRVRDKGRTAIGIMAVILILLFLFQCIENPGEGTDIDIMGTMMNQRSFAEIAEILKELGIEGITDEIVEEMDNNYAHMPVEVLMDMQEVEGLNKAASLLTAVGSGNYDYDTWEWTPGESNVYAFDMEVYNISQMYTFFLRGVSAIGEGELDFTNVKEDMSNVDQETGTGKRIITFEWKGSAYTLEAEENQDWFDFQVAQGLNEIIAAQGGSKKLYFASDGYQECIVFYCDKDWAKEFEGRTGLELED